MLHIAIIGTGDALRQRAETWTRVQEAAVTGIVDTVGGTDAAQNVPEQMQSLVVNRLVDVAANVDVIDICAPADEQADWIKQAAAKNVPIICDLPMGATPGEARDAMETCQANAVTCYPVNPFQFAPVFQNAQTHVQKGAIGKPGVLRFTVREAHSNDTSDIFTALGTGLFAWIQTTFGDVIRITAKHVEKTSKHGDPVTYGVITLRLEDGTIIHTELTRAGETNLTSFELSGDRGMLTYDSRDSDPIVMEDFTQDANNKPAGDMVLNKSVLERQLEHIAGCIETHTTPAITVEDAISAMKVAQAANASAQAGEPVSTERGDAE